VTRWFCRTAIRSPSFDWVAYPKTACNFTLTNDLA